MQRPRPLPAALGGAAFDTDTAARAGVGRNRLRRKDLHSPFRGVRTTTRPGTLHERCEAYLPRMRPGQVFSHVTSAALLGLPLPFGLGDGPLHVSAVRPMGAPRTAGVVGHRLSVAPETTVLDGLPVCSHPETWCQLASVLGLDDLIVVADHLLTRTTMSETRARSLLERAIEANRREGAALLRQAISEARRGSQSPGETRVRLLLVRSGLPEPLLNHRVHDAFGRYLGKGDLVWPEQKVVLEYEGAQHGLDIGQFRYDVERYERFRDAGWTVIRVTADDLRPERRPALVARVRARLGL
jgi:very-short-patch-repair endonuclease